MNKVRRFELKMLHYKRRLKKYGIKDDSAGNHYAFRSHGKPCSCWVCRSDKYNRAGEKQKYIRELDLV